MNEIWKDIKGYETLYMVSNLGRVINLKTNRILIDNSQNTYCSVTLVKKNKSKKYLVHRLVAQSFLKNNEKHRYVNHIDHNPRNNKLENLEWCNAKYNSNHGETKYKASVPVIAYNSETKEKLIFKSLADAKRAGFNYTMIKECLRNKNKNKKHKGFEWFYVDANKTSRSKSKSIEDPKIFKEVM